ncbi:hypothetical protein [Hyalangium sp.]|uniref:hypothetical protein n=1 Tax=Hyalangium sp. TaxID=2028555 RepID=UPI002D557B25|nr:hypothetical protein [Hyalangium sp.]HYH99820.1 hypothetical protein [Hyalangium sp.]
MLNPRCNARFMSFQMMLLALAVQVGTIATKSRLTASNDAGTPVKEREKATKEASELTFKSMDSALDWLREHKTELIIGTVVVIAGVSFIIATGGSGALLLVPAAL